MKGDDDAPQRDSIGGGPVLGLLVLALALLFMLLA